MSRDEAAAGAQKELAACRERIEAIDREIIGLLAERLAIGRRTGVLKQSTGLPILDPAREAEVIRYAVAAGRERELPGESVREIFWQIVGMSRRAQEPDR